jgi:hypothetical protein
MRAGRTSGSAPVGSSRCWLCCSNSRVAVHSLALENSPELAHNPAPVRYIAVVDISAAPCIVCNNHCIVAGDNPPHSGHWQRQHRCRRSHLMPLRCRRRGRRQRRRRAPLQDRRQGECRQHYRRVMQRRDEGRARVAELLPAQLGIGAVKGAMLAIEVHRHPAVTAILDVRGIDGGLDLVAADGVLQQNADWRVYPGAQANVVRPLDYTKLPLATTAARGRDGWISAVPDFARPVIPMA